MAGNIITGAEIHAYSQQPVELLDLPGLHSPLIVIIDENHTKAKLLYFLFKLKLVPAKYDLAAQVVSSTHYGP